MIPASNFLILYFLSINILTFVAFGLDKMKANYQFSRIPEKALWILCALGGSIGGLLGMKVFRHKTKKNSFQAVLLFILLVQIILISLLFYYSSTIFSGLGVDQNFFPIFNENRSMDF